LTPTSRPRTASRTPDDLARDYRAAFLRYLPRQAEAAAHSGYELGRSVVVDGVSILERTRLHREVFLEVLGDTAGED
jgi:hypothetical protein